MLYLGWVVAAFLTGVLATLLFQWRRKRMRLKKRFFALDTCVGLSYGQVLEFTGIAPKTTCQRAGGQTLRTWIDDGYAISLLFDPGDICLGVEEEKG